MGTFNDPEQLETAYTYPAGLLTPAGPDTAWTTAAKRVLAGQRSNNLLTRDFLARNLAPNQAQAWLTEQTQRLQRLTADAVVDGEGDTGFLTYEIAVLDFFRAMEKGDLGTAGNIATRLCNSPNHV